MAPRSERRLKRYSNSARWRAACRSEKAWNVPQIAFFRLPSAVFTQRKIDSFCGRWMRLVTNGLCVQPASVTASKQDSPSLTTAHVHEGGQRFHECGHC